MSKTWLDFQDQLDLLKQRGLVVGDELTAIHHLQRIGYYRLAGYAYSFRQIIPNNTPPKRRDTFIQGSHFDDIIQLYQFDKRLRLLAFEAIEQIEMAIRTDIAYTLGKRHVNAHEKSECLDAGFCNRFGKRQGKKDLYSQKSDHHAWLDKYDSLVNRAKKQAFVKHNLDTYGCLPIWVACEILDFGALSRLYGGLKYQDRQSIAKKYKTTPDLLSQWLRSLNFIRNIVAHHGRLWNVNMIDRSNISASFPNTSVRQLDNQKPFAYFYLMAHLVEIISPQSDWKVRLIQHLNHFPVPRNSAVSLQDFGYLSAFKKYGW
ncbi:Abi family protein [Moraxella nasibovis]|uniref:Abi family protein n=1 Tax=Moraxella nasibovis TaxID=2904120 RepID=UPI002410ACDA|nr:Abi family protein [Moraxella nasibovis]WFF38865.1 Abi family protein [Moraxella nasibovis]